ncbi:MULTISPECIES: 30S ribosome-binding factor RbfA [Caproicibacterium]|jgi:ribosome-binding factor A|uniref:Ribosome-binding factor A n=1 Tax=Caproicibacterium lactatifermentans TaxID=2666138 RepID=A0A859DSL5_9FIRM|nr:30S ribosome-binding factor RbfA [Caproicibacterium lactatifermentans]ARP51186.1 ribosome-binding factor A [Ruminococcaceae bacterium CPB6]MDD4806993.1 30S ribosome-binding factor RbfA [Oscillospiraceae bacterium]QKN24686.1 30S ribosome-binding factor RbfA [Caproicibacterium lactatifermentans]QKO30185.1 30S ribosome-binding factor RbfA [Caproicibacterium lactatifermentans]
MPSYKLDRTTEDIRRELTAVFRELKDPRVSNTLLSIVRVEVSRDLSYCTVYVSDMEGMERAQRAVQGLKSAAGFIRHELGSRLSLRHVPELTFKATDSIEYSANISRILEDLKEEKHGSKPE